MWRIAFLCSCLLWIGLTGCATPVHHSLEKLKVGMDKSEVLEMAGNPKRTHRQGSVDQWTYIYFVNGHEHQTDLRFADNRVVEILPTKVNLPAKNDEGQVIMKDYERLVREKQNQKKP